MHARVPGLNLTGGAQASARQRGRWRGEADRRGPPVIPNPESRQPASSPATMQVTARSGESTAGLSVVSPFGWRWSWTPEQPGSPATRSCGGGASGVGGSGRSQLQKEWGNRGEGSVVPRSSRSRENGGGGGLYRANADEPRRRSSSSISSSGGSRGKLVVREVD